MSMLYQRSTEIVQFGYVTDEGLAALRAQLPYADLSDLERDRRLNRIDDLFTVGLLSSFITWKLGGSDETDSVVHSAGTSSFPRGTDNIGRIDRDLIMMEKSLSHRSSPSTCR